MSGYEQDRYSSSDGRATVRIGGSTSSAGYAGRAAIVTPERILSVMAEESGISLELLLCARRDRKIARPRQLAMYLMRKLCFELSLAKIGASVGGRDHKTVMHACDLMDYLLTRDRNLQDLQQRVLNRLYGSAQ
ncbi:helix-turn-helix domain-containing protein [Denitrobaculum tricleocarpae]|uniref:Chromosomal replication initiator DnaA C-terminal domain-containing protein n=1 Tax=Denitrobaculum tricleocarpae TaxID=2591009 RepID=A0A545TUG4_9PROT|nr:hypothetical protein FKG95_11980 [Denitrobaculum tricleocarpae]